MTPIRPEKLFTEPLIIITTIYIIFVNIKAQQMHDPEKVNPKILLIAQER